MSRLKKTRFSILKTQSLFALSLLALVPAGAYAQDFVLPDFGDDSGEASESRSSTPSSSDGFDFVPSDDISATTAEEFDFEKSSEQVEEEIRGEAFDAALQGLLPLRPNEIRKLLERYDRTQESVEVPVYPAPKPEVAVETLSIDPGTKPTAIKVAHGYVTTLNIVDSTGAPWPIEDITWAGNFEVINSNSGDGGGHFIRISPQSDFAYGNMSIHLLSLQTPVIISLETSRDVVHYRFDAIVPEAGPLAKTPLIEGGISIAAGDVDMAGFLEGIVPQSAQRVSVSGVDGRTSAYNYNGMTYLRTPLTLLSPAWISSASSADGMKVYALGNAPVLLLSEKGKMVRARLSNREDILDE